MRATPHSIINNALIILTCAIAASPPTWLESILLSSAHANWSSDDEPTNGNDTPCSGDCENCPDGGSSPGVEGPATDPDPIVLYTGSVIESATDLSLPSPIGQGWSLSRSYSSSLLTSSGSEAPAFAARWVRRVASKKIPGHIQLHTRLLNSQEVEEVFVFTSSGAFVSLYNSGVGASMFYSRRYVREVGTSYGVGQASRTGTGSDEVIVIDYHDASRGFPETVTRAIYYGFNGAIDAHTRGRMKSLKTLNGPSNDPGYTYIYSADRLDKVSRIIPGAPLSSLGYFVDFPLEASGKSSVRVCKTTGGVDKILQQADYIKVHNNNLPALGSHNDLVQVKVSKRASRDAGIDLSTPVWSSIRYTQYRYYKDGDINGTAHQLKMVFEADAIQRILDDGVDDENGIGGVTPDDILLMSDDDTTHSGRTIREYASRHFEYYTEDLDTGNASTVKCSTPWYPTTGENLHSKYGGTNFDESQHPRAPDPAHRAGMVRSETVNGGCSSCDSSSSGGVTTEYFYLKQHGWLKEENGYDESDRANAAAYSIVADTTDSLGTAVKRRIISINDKGQAIRKAILAAPASPSAAYIWCESKLFGSGVDPDIGDAWQTVESRMPSAHRDEVASNADLAQFLNPFEPNSNSWSNDAATVSSLNGVVSYYEYNENGQITGELVRRGAGAGNRHYVSATDWGDGLVDDEPIRFPIATYQYPIRTDNRGHASRTATTFTYDFWDVADKTVRLITTTLPAVPVTENGSGIQTTTYSLYDTRSRLRWSKDGEGTVTYHSYDSLTGKLAYTMVDVDTDDLPSEISTSWPEALENIFSNPDDDNLELVAKYEFDEQGRPCASIDFGGKKHVTFYGADETVTFPFVDATGRPFLPARSIKTTSAGQPLESLSIRPSAVITSGNQPVGYNTSLANFTELTRNKYDDLNGRLLHVDKYTSIASESFIRESYLYDGQGRATVTARTIETNKHQVNVTTYDILDRPTAQRQAVLSSLPPDNASAVTSTNLVKSIEYDDNTSGDGHVTVARTHHSATAYTDLHYHRNFRGFVRGIGRTYTNGATENVTPCSVFDIDWMGRTTSAALYTSLPNWNTLKSGEGDAAYVSSPSTSGFDRVDTMYDKLGRVFRKESYPGTSASKLQYNRFFDRNNKLVCAGQKHGKQTEYVYDAAGRLYQERTKVIEVPMHFTSGPNAGKVKYCAPQPTDTWPSPSDEMAYGLVEATHRKLDSAGNVTAEYKLEANFFVNDLDTPVQGIADLHSYVMNQTFYWYNDANQLRTIANLGSGNDMEDSWSCFDPAYGFSEPSVSGPLGNYFAVVTRYGYNANSGRREIVEFPSPGASPSPAQVRSKTFHDDLGRRLHIAENHADFSPPSTNIGGGFNNDEDRVTSFEYDGANNIRKTIARNLATPDDDQITEYAYDDPVNAVLVTKAVYPDGNSSSNYVQYTYNLDGSVATIKDQRQVTHTYTYNNRRQVTLDAATISPNSGVYGDDSESDAVRSIKKQYDARGRLEYIHSCSDPGATTVLNSIRSNYSDSSTGAAYTGRFHSSDQYHDATTAFTVTDLVDASGNSGVFNNGLRSRGISYPGNSFQVNYEFGDDNPLSDTGNENDRLSRVSGIEVDPDGSSGGAAAANQVKYKYNGVSRLVDTDYVVPAVRRKMYDNGGGGTFDGLDRFGRPARCGWYDYSSGSILRDRVDYGYDYASNRISRDIPSELYVPNDRDEAYSYDGLHRLRSSLRGTLSDSDLVSRQNEQQWTYDGLSNWTVLKQRDSDPDPNWDSTSNRTYDKANEIVTLSPNTLPQPANDAAGNLTTIPQPRNPSNALFLKYDAWNRMVEARDASNLLQKNEYDGLHRRIVKEGFATGTPYETRHYFYNDKWQVVEERVGANLSTAKVDVRYAWHPQYIDSLAIRYWDHDDNAATALIAHYYLQDANHNVTAVVNNSGSVVERYAYTPYGEVTFLNGASGADLDGVVSEWSVDTGGSDLSNTHLFTGRESDPETGLQLNRYRFYSWHLGRWLGRDPLGYTPNQLNLHEYGRSNPTDMPDPFGLFTIEKFSGEFKGYHAGMKQWMDDYLTYTVEIPWKCNRAGQAQTGTVEITYSNIKYQPDEVSLSVIVGVVLGEKAILDNVVDTAEACKGSARTQKRIEFDVLHVSYGAATLGLDFQGIGANWEFLEDHTIEATRHYEYVASCCKKSCINRVPGPQPEMWPNPKPNTSTSTASSNTDENDGDDPND